jgi:NAD+ synthase
MSRTGRDKIVFHSRILSLVAEHEISRIADFIRRETRGLKRRGMVVGLSGGIDSTLIAELCAAALGKEHVLGIILPEKDSNPVSLPFAQKCADKLGIATETVDISSVLNAYGIYDRMTRIIREVFPEYGPGFGFNIALPPDLLTQNTLNVFSLTIADPEGRTRSARLNRSRYLEIMAAANVKQRLRMMFLYDYAERKDYSVCGTTNRTEYIQGFFVKHGDGGVDIEPIAHLYKTQVYELAAHLGVPEEILNRPPSPDTFSLPVSDEEFFFRIPYRTLDLLMYAWDKGIPETEAAETLNLSVEQVRRAFRDFAVKMKRTEHLRTMPPHLLEPSGEQS